MLSTGNSEFKSELEDSITSLGIALLPVDKSEEIISRIKDRYVDGNPRAWWLTLKNKKNVFSYSDNSGYQHISKAVSCFGGSEKIKLENIFLIADEDNDYTYIYDIPFSSISHVIENCRFFEYYIIPHDLSWLICENEHGDLIVCSEN